MMSVSHNRSEVRSSQRNPRPLGTRIDPQMRHDDLEHGHDDASKTPGTATTATPTTTKTFSDYPSAVRLLDMSLAAAGHGRRPMSVHGHALDRLVTLGGWLFPVGMAILFSTIDASHEYATLRWATGFVAASSVMPFMVLVRVAVSRVAAHDSLALLASLEGTASAAASWHHSVQGAFSSERPPQIGEA